MSDNETEGYKTTTDCFLQELKSLLYPDWRSYEVRLAKLDPKKWSNEDVDELLLYLEWKNTIRETVASIKHYASSEDETEYWWDN